ncbi:host attachment protein [Dyella soli]|uniref:Host attachment protein n=1 Tax=Dyella soli TaxID=522319 RepID=A0A4R0YM64_9GAMM|nr:host attachment protein [Dyella soli]TCI06829.1 host attachment protein [Dyella soli]
MKKTVWIVVANRAVARLFRTNQPMGPLEEMDAFIHPEGRLQEHELVSDRAGRGFERMGQGGFAEDTDTTAIAHETANFALALTRFLQKGRTDGRFDVLVLIAAPAFLGSLRERMDGPTRERVMLEVDKNLVHLDAATLRGYLPERLYSAVDG